MNKNLNFWIFAGEESGDIYGARLAEELKKQAAAQGCGIKIAAMGGTALKNTGAEIMVDSTELGVVGFIEVFKHIFLFINIFQKLVKRAESERPDAVVLIDYPGFNLRFAAAMHRRKIPVIWYISPQIWTWGKWRMPKLVKFCRKMLVIFPFETEVYASTSLAAEFVGHPLVDIVSGRRDDSIQRDPDTLLILPGSRFSEIDRLLMPMLDTVAEMHRRHPALKFVLSAPREKIFDRCRKFIADYRSNYGNVLPDIELSCGKTAYWMQRAGTGLAASGTVTVEAAIAGLPLVVAYRMNWITVLFAACLVKLYRGFFTMVNIIADKQVFEEFFQHKVTVGNLAGALDRILPGGPRRTEVEDDMKKVTAAISGKKEDACANAAQACIECVNEIRQKSLFSA